MATANLHINGF